MENKLLEQMLVEGLKEQNILGNDAILHCDLVYFHKGNRALRHFVGFGAGKGKSLTNVTITKDGKELHKFSVSSKIFAGAFGGNSSVMFYDTAYNIIHYVKKNIMHQKVLQSKLNLKSNLHQNQNQIYQKQRKIYGD